MAVKKPKSFLTKRFFQRLLEVDSTQLQEVGDFAADRIRSFARLGKSLVSGQPEDFKPLAESTIKSRESFDRNHETGDFFRPSKSNITLTGQLLESLDGTVNKSNQTVTVEPKGRRDDGLTNKKVAEFVQEGGREFIGLDKKGKARIVEILDRAIRNNIRKRQKR